MNIKFFFKSFFLFSYILRKKHYDIVFYYPAHFNRDINGKNGFFEPLYELCRKNNITYLVIEEPYYSKKVFRNPQAVPFDFMLPVILVLHKIIPLRKFQSFEHRDWFIAKFLKPLFFRNFQFQNYIVLSNSMMGFFRGLNSEAKLYDYQHGVITSQHRGYVNIDASAPDHIKLNDANVLVFGVGFQNVLKNAVTDKYYHTHTYTLGQRLSAQFENHYGKRKILFSLQFADPNPVFNGNILDKIILFFKKYADYFVSNQITILLKHHPRFQNDIDPSPLYEFEFTELCVWENFSCLDACCLHLTLNSTTTFEAALTGTPTLLMENDFLSPHFFIDDYQYPLGTKSEADIIKIIETYLHNETCYLEDAKKVFEWYHLFYSKIDEQLFVRLMKGEK